jgi:peptidoglycan L-alanyl-D-glutamate endopeptidase CwlK
MPIYSPHSQRQLATAHQDLQILFLRVIPWYDHRIEYGWRDAATQTRLYEQGRSQLPWPNSKHNHYREQVKNGGETVLVPESLAVDAIPWVIEYGGHIWPQPHEPLVVQWEKKRYFYHLAGVVQAIARELRSQGLMEHRIRWGGDWNGDLSFKDQKFDDLAHFELIV